MRTAKLEDMVRGWFVGNFEPSVQKTDQFEVAIQRYVAGDKESLHHHKVATEITVILNGRVVMFGNEYSDGDIITIAPGESTSFEALTDVTTVVVKFPCVPGDKYLGSS